jgi:hypothetical protein
MTPEVAKIANSPGFWLVCIPMVLVMLFQSYIFMKKAWKFGVSMGIPKEKMVRGLRSGAITSIAPAFSVLIALVGLIAIVGSALAWQRLSVIGAIMYEGFAAQTALAAMGTAVGDPGYTPVAFANCVWVMALGSAGWILITALLTHKLEWLRIKAVRGKMELLPICTICAVLGAFGYQVAKHAVTVSRSTIAVVASALCMILLNYITNKTGKRWIREWSLGFAMLVGMFAATIGVTL